MKLYQVKNWNLYFENNKSRERQECSFVCVPNKQDGMGFNRIMAEPDGAAIYGVWCLILGLLSRQKSPRAGWMTEDGHQTGTVLAPSDLAFIWRRNEAEITRALEFLATSRVGWLEVVEVVEDQSQALSARAVPVECPPSALERREEKEVKEEKGTGTAVPANAPAPKKQVVEPSQPAAVKPKFYANEVAAEMDKDGFKQAWEDWIVYRYQRAEAGEPFTSMTRRSNMSYCERLGTAKAVNVIRFSIEKGCKSLVDPTPEQMAAFLAAGAQTEKPNRELTPEEQRKVLLSRKQKGKQ